MTAPHVRASIGHIRCSILAHPRLSEHGEKSVNVSEVQACADTTSVYIARLYRTRYSRQCASPLFLLTNYPVISHADPLAGGDLQLRFVDAPDLATVFRACGVYDVLESCDLTVPLTPEACRHLARPELKQVEYWKH